MWSCGTIKTAVQLHQFDSHRWLGVLTAYSLTVWWTHHSIFGTLYLLNLSLQQKFILHFIYLQ
jgi:hypothetical protein